MQKPFLGKMAVSVLIGLVRVAASLAFVWICKVLVDIATGASGLDLGRHIAIMIIIVVVQIVSGIAASWWENYIITKSQNTMRLNTFSHVINSSWNGRETFSSGDIVNRLEEDIRVLVDIFCSRMPAIIITICQLVAASIFMLKMQPDLLWFLLILMAFAIVGSRLYFKKLRKLTAKIREEDAAIQQHMQENLQNRALVLTLIGAEKVLDKLGYHMGELTSNVVTRLNFNSLSRAFMAVGFLGGYTAAFIWGVYGLKDSAITYGMMTALLQLVGQIQRPVSDLARHVPAFIHALTSVERIMELEELPDAEKIERLDCHGAPEIVVDNLTFKYPQQQKPVFEGFSCKFAAGGITAVTGPTGVGKSTLVRLVMGLLTPQGGSITLFRKRDYMYVPQGNSLMSGTVRENLLLADDTADEQQMRSVLSCAVADFVFDLPDGLDTMCGEKGGGLSEGQAQRIAIARALLHKGHILILDEATSALDSKTEEQLLCNIKARFGGAKTIIFITHREMVSLFSDAVLPL